MRPREQSVVLHAVLIRVVIGQAKRAVPGVPDERVLRNNQQRKNGDGFPAQQQRLEWIRGFADGGAPEKNSQCKLKREAQKNWRNGKPAVDGQEEIRDGEFGERQRRHVKNDERSDQQDSGLRLLKRHPDERREQPEKQRRAQDQNLCSRPERERQFRQRANDKPGSAEDRRHEKFAEPGAEPVAGDDLRGLQRREAVAVPKPGLAFLGQRARNFAEPADDHSKRISTPMVQP